MPLKGKAFIHPFHLARLLTSPDINQDFSARPQLEKARSAIDAAATLKPDILFLSSEDISTRPNKFSAVKRNLARWTRQTKVLLYVRDPVSFYRSMVQHHVKSQYYVPSPGSWQSDFLKTITQGHAVFGEEFETVPFQRSTLREGSVVNDCVHRCGQAVPENENFDTVLSNSSSAAETSVVLQNFMRQFQPKEKKYGPLNIKLRLFLEQAARDIGLDGKCHLKKSVRETILSRQRDELVQLRNEYGLTFDTIDYATLDRQKVHEETLKYDTITELCEVDPEIVAALTDAVNTSFLPQHGLPPLSD